MCMMLAMGIADELSGWREETGLSLEAVAAPLGVSRQTICNWEAGRSEPKLSQLVELERLAGGLLKRVKGLV